MPATGHYLWLVLAPASVYVQAIVSIVSILEKYDEDKNFEAYGFGGMLPNGQVWRTYAVVSQLCYQSWHVRLGIEESQRDYFYAMLRDGNACYFNQLTAAFVNSGVTLLSFVRAFQPSCMQGCGRRACSLQYVSSESYLGRADAYFRGETDSLQTTNFLDCCNGLKPSYKSLSSPLTCAFWES